MAQKLTIKEFAKRFSFSEEYVRQMCREKPVGTKRIQPHLPPEWIKRKDGGRWVLEERQTTNQNHLDELNRKIKELRKEKGLRELELLVKEHGDTLVYEWISNQWQSSALFSSALDGKNTTPARIEHGKGLFTLLGACYRESVTSASPVDLRLRFTPGGKFEADVFTAKAKPNPLFHLTAYKEAAYVPEPFNSLWYVWLGEISPPDHIGLKMRILEATQQIRDLGLCQACGKPLPQPSRPTLKYCLNTGCQNRHRVWVNKVRKGNKWAIFERISKRIKLIRAEHA